MKSLRVIRSYTSGLFCSRFVLYQLSKNLNRPFFMDFLTQLSIRYTEKSAVLDEEDPEDAGKSRRNIFYFFLFIYFYLICSFKEITWFPCY